MGSSVCKNVSIRNISQRISGNADTYSKQHGALSGESSTAAEAPSVPSSSTPPPAAAAAAPAATTTAANTVDHTEKSGGPASSNRDGKTAELNEVTLVGEAGKSNHAGSPSPPPALRSGSKSSSFVLHKSASHSRIIATDPSNSDNIAPHLRKLLEEERVAAAANPPAQVAVESSAAQTHGLHISLDAIGKRALSDEESDSETYDEGVFSSRGTKQSANRIRSPIGAARLPQGDWLSNVSPTIRPPDSKPVAAAPATGASECLSLAQRAAVEAVAAAATTNPTQPKDTTARSLSTSSSDSGYSSDHEYVYLDYNIEIPMHYNPNEIIPGVLPRDKLRAVLSNFRFPYVKEKRRKPAKNLVAGPTTAAKPLNAKLQQERAQPPARLPPKEVEQSKETAAKPSAQISEANAKPTATTSTVVKTHVSNRLNGKGAPSNGATQGKSSAAPKDKTLDEEHSGVISSNGPSGATTARTTKGSSSAPSEALNPTTAQALTIEQPECAVLRSNQPISGANEKVQGGKITASPAPVLRSQPSTAARKPSPLRELMHDPEALERLLKGQNSDSDSDSYVEEDAVDGDDVGIAVKTPRRAKSRTASVNVSTPGTRRPPHVALGPASHAAAAGATTTIVDVPITHSAKGPVSFGDSTTSDVISLPRLCLQPAYNNVSVSTQTWSTVGDGPSAADRLSKQTPASSTPTNTHRRATSPVASQRNTGSSSRHGSRNSTRAGTTSRSGKEKGLSRSFAASTTASAARMRPSPTKPKQKASPKRARPLIDNEAGFVELDDPVYPEDVKRSTATPNERRHATLKSTAAAAARANGIATCEPIHSKATSDYVELDEPFTASSWIQVEPQKAKSRFGSHLKYVDTVAPRAKQQQQQRANAPVLAPEYSASDISTSTPPTVSIGPVTSKGKPARHTDPLANDVSKTAYQNITLQINMLHQEMEKHRNEFISGACRGMCGGVRGEQALFVFSSPTAKSGARATPSGAMMHAPVKFAAIPQTSLSGSPAVQSPRPNSQSKSFQLRNGVTNGFFKDHNCVPPAHVYWHDTGRSISVVFQPAFSGGDVSWKLHRFPLFASLVKLPPQKVCSGSGRNRNSSSDSMEDYEVVLHIEDAELQHFGGADVVQTVRLGYRCVLEFVGTTRTAPEEDQMSMPLILPTNLHSNGWFSNASSPVMQQIAPNLLIAGGNARRLGLPGIETVTPREGSVASGGGLGSYIKYDGESVDSRSSIDTVSASPSASTFNASSTINSLALSAATASGMAFNPYHNTLVVAPVLLMLPLAGEVLAGKVHELYDDQHATLTLTFEKIRPKNIYLYYTQNNGSSSSEEGKWEMTVAPRTADSDKHIRWSQLAATPTPEDYVAFCKSSSANGMGSNDSVPASSDKDGWLREGRPTDEELAANLAAMQTRKGTRKAAKKSVELR